MLLSISALSTEHNRENRPARIPANRRIPKISFAERDRSLEDLYEHFISLGNVDHETNAQNGSKANRRKHTNILCQQSSFSWYRAMCAICAICAQT